MRNLLQPALLINKTNEIIVICDNTSAQPWQKPRWVKQLSEHFRERKGLAAVVSVGPSVANALKIESSYRLAKQTAKIALSLGETGVKHYADFLGPSLLLRALGTPEHEYLQDQVITPLREYDRQYHNDLLPTLLAAIFAPDLNTVAAELNVHVNTVRYRLEKIAAITGYDFFTVRDKFTLTTAALLELNGSKK